MTTLIIITDLFRLVEEVREKAKVYTVNFFHCSNVNCGIRTKEILLRFQADSLNQPEKVCVCMHALIQTIDKWFVVTVQATTTTKHSSL